MLFNTLDRLELDALVCMLDPKYIVVLEFAVRLAHKVDRLAAELGYRAVNGIFVCIMAQDFDLHVKMVFLVLFQPNR